MNEIPFQEDQEILRGKFKEKHGSDVKPPKRPIGTYVVAVVIVIVAIIIVNAISESTPQIELLESETPQTESLDTSTPLQMNIVRSFDLDLFEDRVEAGTVINSTQGKPTRGTGSEKVISGIVNAEEEHVVYFATSSLDLPQKENFVGIYKYNTVSNQWQRLYKTTYGEVEDFPKDVIDSVGGVGIKTLRVAGRDGDNLLLMEDFVSNDIGECGSLLLRGIQPFFVLYKMDINNPYSGLERFTLSSELEAAEFEWTQSCLDSQ